MDPNECSPDNQISIIDVDEILLEKTVNLLAAMADPARLMLLLLLSENEEICVSEIAAYTDDKANTISMRLKKLYDTGLVGKRRKAKHVYYRLKDKHVVDIIKNAVNHAKYI